MATIRDVAKRAGVAPITVSRVMNNSGYVKPETRRRVEEAAAELHYVPNMLAHSFRSKRTNTLALVLPDITNPFWTTVARGVEDVAGAQGFSVFFCNTDENETKQSRYLAALLRRRVDGVLLAPVTNDGTTVQMLLRQNVGVVVIDRKVKNIEVDTVRGDSIGGAYQLVRHLIDLGHRQIAALSGPANLSVSQDRVAGYAQALNEAGLTIDPSLVTFGDFTIESGRDRMQALLARRPRPTAIFAGNNFIAAGALTVMREAGLRTPEDISVVVFDDLPDPYVFEPKLTVAVQPAYELGQVAAQRLLQKINHPATKMNDVCDVILPVQIIIRQSTRSIMT
ncbi:LacI family DNA-binding transcriptional regulator [Caldilinea sp.]|uniref:LacI family DNA-binding transcriptional regulator n=1 Tax=Caldilinea sp. TaxID=2293560 RepID=UPI0021DE498A|nr:LacI family DNA-binding transcriptional regulator [uncultured Caldilinea sp.]GIV64720.1 MAG: LacI family transcriptional regulator [Bellilinea sp.]